MFLPRHSGTRAVLAAMLVLESGVAVSACSSDDSTTATTTDSGVNDATTTSDAGTRDASTDGGSTTDTGASTLYARLGGHDGINAKIAAIFGEEVKDPDIASYFAPNLKNPNHKPQVADIEECLVDLLGQAAGGTETYPTTTAGGFVCRGMDVAHANLHIGNGTFDNFVGIAAAELKTLNVSDTDIATIGGVLNGTKPEIVDKAAPDGGPYLGDTGGLTDAAGGG
jgi:truncated hemoglobin YjbI